MAFVRAAAGWFRANMRGRAGLPHHKPLSGNMPPLDIRRGSQGPWGHVRGTGRSPCHPEDRPFSRGPLLPAGLPPSQRKSAQGRPADLGPGRSAGHASAPGGAGPGGRDPRPQTDSPVGSQASALPGRLTLWLWQKLPHPAPRRQTWTRRLQLSKICAKPPKKGV